MVVAANRQHQMWREILQFLNNMYDMIDVNKNINHPSATVSSLSSILPVHCIGWLGLN
jgi:hypothetical protein